VSGYNGAAGPPAGVSAQEKVQPRGTASTAFVIWAGGAVTLIRLTSKKRRWLPYDFDVLTVRPVYGSVWPLPMVQEGSANWRWCGQ